MPAPCGQLLVPGLVLGQGASWVTGPNTLRGVTASAKLLPDPEEVRRRIPRQATSPNPSVLSECPASSSRTGSVGQIDHLDEIGLAAFRDSREARVDTTRDRSPRTHGGRKRGSTGAPATPCAGLLRMSVLQEPRNCIRTRPIRASIQPCGCAIATPHALSVLMSP
jgi:hypothetical protein